MNLLITAISSATGPSGICRHAYNVLQCAAGRQEVSQITLVLGKWQEQYFFDAFNLKNADVKLVTLNISNDAFARNLWYLKDLPKLADDVAADVVHLSFPVPIRRHTLRCPVIVSLHDLYPYDEANNFGFPKVFFNRVFLQQCLREVDCVACVSETTLSRLKYHYPRLGRKKSVAVYNCVTLESNQPVVPPWIDGRFILMVAQHRANKNISLALEVFDKLRQQEIIDSQTMLLLVGNTGPETAAIKSFTKQRSLEKYIKLVNGVSDGELRWLYTHCEFLMAPSLTEGFGLPVVEALLCGSRVVCSDISAFREVGGRACHYFDPHAQSSSTAMIEAVSSALAKIARPPVGLERFSRETAAREYAALYVQLRKDAAGVLRG